ncbi:MAG: N-6 DNA methylase [archaeon]
MDYVALLSGECIEFSLAELSAYLEARGSRFKVKDRDERVVVFEADKGVDFSMLALTHEVSLFFGYTVDDVNTKMLDNRVNVRAMKFFKGGPLSSEAIERKVGKRLQDNGIKVDFSSGCVVRIHITKDKCYFGKVACLIDRKGIRKRDAKLRPYFMTGSINAIYARAFVNLARGIEGRLIGDPFCGSGAFLIEAGLMGMKVFGCDIAKEHVSGCIANLAHYGVDEADVRVMDALAVPGIRIKFDAVVSDLPWGKSTFLKYDKNELYRRFMEILPRILKKGRYAVVAGDAPQSWHPPELQLVSSFELYVHKSAKRYVSVFRN